MSIIKNKLIQIISVGLLFAFILGVISFITRDGMVKDKKNYEKQIVIVDVFYKNRINDYLNKINDIRYLDRNLDFGQELFKSLKYIQLRYQNDNKSVVNCFNFSMNLTDNSIFIQTNTYPSINTEQMDQCLEDVFVLSFKRLKEKLDLFNYRAMTATSFELEEEDKQLNEKNKNDNLSNNKNLAKITKSICDDLDKVLREFDFSENSSLQSGSDNDDIQKSILSIFTYHQNLIAAKTLEQFCELRMDTSKKKEFLFHLQELNALIKDAKFDDIYKVKKIYQINTEQDNQYLSTKNIVFTFSIFGFIFGALLVYNFGSSKKKNE